MKKLNNTLKIFLTVFLCLSIVGCATVPTGFLKASEQSLKDRQLQMRQYETKDEQKIVTSVAGVLQDLGFILDNSETELGFVAASKKADATSGGQIAAAVLADTVGIAAALIGAPCYTNAVSRCDKEQMVKASVITQPSLDGSKTVVRVTFQRIVWNMSNLISRIETVKEPDIYQKFYDSLSKAIFLEAEQI
ncbi:MAG: hypothetical protein WC738_03340 [Candidatus Omnitrophota bacterium]|jgi:hypothetical protein